MNDAISRSAVLEILCNGCNSRNNTPVPRCGDMCTDFKEVLKLTALDVAPVVHARWEYLYCDSVCSACGHINRADRLTRLRDDTKYCPNCGARMDGDAHG